MEFPFPFKTESLGIVSDLYLLHQAKVFFINYLLAFTTKKKTIKIKISVVISILFWNFKFFVLKSPRDEGLSVDEKNKIIYIYFLFLLFQKENKNNKVTKKIAKRKKKLRSKKNHGSWELFVGITAFEKGVSKNTLQFVFHTNSKNTQLNCDMRNTWIWLVKMEVILIQKWNKFYCFVSFKGTG